MIGKGGGRAEGREGRILRRKEQEGGEGEVGGKNEEGRKGEAGE